MQDDRWILLAVTSVVAVLELMTAITDFGIALLNAILFLLGLTGTNG